MAEDPTDDDLAHRYGVPETGEKRKPTDDDLVRVLEDVRLGCVFAQRLAFARLLLSKPKLVLLDESTSALDEDNEAHLYKQIEAAGITYVSVGHRKALYESVTLSHSKRFRSVFSSARQEVTEQVRNLEWIIHQLCTQAEYQGLDTQI